MPITQPGGGKLAFLGSTTLTGDASSIAVSGMATSDYTHLMFVLDYWSDSANGNDLRIRFNNSNANYASYMQGAAAGASTAQAGNNTDVTLYTTTVNGQPTKGMVVGYVRVTGDSGNAHNFVATGGGDKMVAYDAGYYSDANAITRIDALVTFGTLKTGCRLSVWGVKQ